MLESDVLSLSEESYELYLSGLMSLAPPPYDAMTPQGFVEREYGVATVSIKKLEERAALAQDCCFLSCTHVWLLTSLRCNPHGTLYRSSAKPS